MVDGGKISSGLLGDDTRVCCHPSCQLPQRMHALSVGEGYEESFVSAKI